MGSSYYRPQRSNVFTPVCHSGRHSLLGRHPPPPTETANAADGTHPTVMHSCSRSVDGSSTNLVDNTPND